MDSKDHIAEVVQATPTPETGRIPAWILEEIMDWVEGAKTGDLTLHFESGTPRFFRYEGVINPLRGDGPTGYVPLRWQSPPVCPGDRAPMAERDYGERFECSRCHKVYTYWQLLKMRDAWTPDQWAEISSRKAPGGGRA